MGDVVSKDFVRISILYDFYGKLLTQKQKDVFSLYYSENMSLSEIADEFGISRQAVHDNLKNAQNALESYENELELIKRTQMREKLAKRAYALIDESLKFEVDCDNQKKLRELKDIVEAMES
ncbi:MAG: YlxM family DNA-binding protein [Eubacteriales bacterium]